MDLKTFLVSNPPHKEIDYGAASGLLGLTTAEVRMKTSFQAPEVWLAFSSLGEAKEAANSARGAGLNAIVIDGRELLDVPGPAPVATFEFADGALVGRFPDGELNIPYDAEALGVFCKPPSGFGAAPSSPKRPSIGRSSTLVSLDAGGVKSRGLQAADALELMTNLDLYTPVDGKTKRVSITQELVDFSGLGELMQPSGGANMATSLSACKQRFAHLTLDARLENVRPRQKPMVGNGTQRQHEDRKLLSFGTLALRHLLESVSPDLRDVTQYELGSRLAYLIWAQA